MGGGSIDSPGGSEWEGVGIGNRIAKSENISNESGLKRDLDPLDISAPRSAYFFLSDDVQDDLDGRDKPLMRCISCGQRFKGVIYDSCPKCFSINTEEIVI